MKGLMNTEAWQGREMIFSLFHRELSLKKFQLHAVVHSRRSEKANALCLRTEHQIAQHKRGRPDVSPLDQSQRNKKKEQINRTADRHLCRPDQLLRSGSSIDAGFREKRDRIPMSLVVVQVAPVPSREIISYGPDGIPEKPGGRSTI